MLTKHTALPPAADAFLIKVSGREPHWITRAANDACDAIGKEYDGRHSHVGHVAWSSLKARYGNFNLLDTFGLTNSAQYPPPPLHLETIGLRPVGQAYAKAIFKEADRLGRPTQLLGKRVFPQDKKLRIPPFLHTFWSGTLRDELLHRVYQQEQMLKALRPDAEVILWTDRTSLENPEFLQTVQKFKAATGSSLKVLCVEDLLDLRESPLGESWLYHQVCGKAAALSDIARTEYLRKFGGIHLDLDELNQPAWNKALIDYYGTKDAPRTDYPPNETHLRVCRNLSGFIAARAGHPVMDQTRENLVELYIAAKEEAQAYRTWQASLQSNPKDALSPDHHSAKKPRTTKAPPKPELKHPPFIERYFRTINPVTGEDKPMLGTDPLRNLIKPRPVLLDPVQQATDVQIPRALENALCKHAKRLCSPEEWVTVPPDHTSGELSWLRLRHPAFDRYDLIHQGLLLLTIAMREMAIHSGFDMEFQFKTYFHGNPDLKVVVEDFLATLEYVEDHGIWMEKEFAHNRSYIGNYHRQLREADKNLLLIEANRSNPNKQSFTEEQFIHAHNKAHFLPQDSVTLPDLEAATYRTSSVMVAVLQNKLYTCAQTLLDQAGAQCPDDALSWMYDHLRSGAPHADTVCTLLAQGLATQTNAWKSLITLLLSDASAREFARLECQDLVLAACLTAIQRHPPTQDDLIAITQLAPQDRETLRLILGDSLDCSSPVHLLLHLPLDIATPALAQTLAVEDPEKNSAQKILRGIRQVTAEPRERVDLLIAVLSTETLHPLTRDFAAALPKHEWDWAHFEKRNTTKISPDLWYALMKQSPFHSNPVPEQAAYELKIQGLEATMVGCPQIDIDAAILQMRIDALEIKIPRLMHAATGTLPDQTKTLPDQTKEIVTSPPAKSYPKRKASEKGSTPGHFANMEGDEEMDCA